MVDVHPVSAGSDVIDALDDSGIPSVARAADDNAEARLAAEDPGCGIDWSLLADGNGTRKILGIPLDGRAHVALIRDTDGGELDSDRTYDRAVGPMQIIPTTWRASPRTARGTAGGTRTPDLDLDDHVGRRAGRGPVTCRVGRPGTADRPQAFSGRG